MVETKNSEQYPYRYHTELLINPYSNKAKLSALPCLIVSTLLIRSIKPISIIIHHFSVVFLYNPHLKFTINRCVYQLYLSQEIDPKFKISNFAYLTSGVKHLDIFSFQRKNNIKRRRFSTVQSSMTQTAYALLFLCL